jgi:hypothetical protein
VSLGDDIAFFGLNFKMLFLTKLIPASFGALYIEIEHLEFKIRHNSWSYSGVLMKSKTTILKIENKCPSMNFVS